MDAAVPPVALLVSEDGLEEMSLPDVGPQRIRHPDFRIGDLPDRKLLTRLSPLVGQQIGIGLGRRIEKADDRA